VVRRWNRCPVCRLMIWRGKRESNKKKAGAGGQFRFVRIYRPILEREAGLLFFFEGFVRGGSGWSVGAWGKLLEFFRGIGPRNTTCLGFGPDFVKTLVRANICPRYPWKGKKKAPTAFCKLSFAGDCRKFPVLLLF